MKTVLNKLKTSKEKIVKKALQRDVISLKNSEKWQDSQAGKDYEIKTGKLADSVEDINSAITNLESFLNKNHE